MVIRSIVDESTRTHARTYTHIYIHTYIYIYIYIIGSRTHHARIDRHESYYIIITCESYYIIRQKYYIIRQQVYYIIRRCYYIIRRFIITGDYYIISCNTRRILHSWRVSRAVTLGERREPRSQADGTGPSAAVAAVAVACSSGRSLSPIRLFVVSCTGFICNIKVVITPNVNNLARDCTVCTQVSDGSWLKIRGCLPPKTNNKNKAIACAFTAQRPKLMQKHNFDLWSLPFSGSRVERCWWSLKHNYHIETNISFTYRHVHVKNDAPERLRFCSFYS